MHEPVCFFVHHQGCRHARRTMAIIERMAKQRPVSIVTAEPSLFDSGTSGISDRARPCFAAGSAGGR